MSSVSWTTWQETPCLLPPFLHTGSNQKLEAGKAWEEDLVGILRPVVKVCHGCHKGDRDIQGIHQCVPGTLSQCRYQASNVVN